MTSFNTIGIDPGHSGGVVLLSSALHEGFPLPMGGKSIAGAQLASILRVWNDFVGIDLVAVEDVHSRPGEGVNSPFTFGRGFGRIEGVLQCLGLSYQLVKPQAWKRVILKGTARDKKAAIDFVRGRYPTIDLLPGQKRVPHDGIADAACIAAWAAHILHNP